MCQSMGEFAVVREDEQSGRIGVEPADVKQSLRPAADERLEIRPTLLVGH